MLSIVIKLKTRMSAALFHKSMSSSAQMNPLINVMQYAVFTKEKKNVSIVTHHLVLTIWNDFRTET